MEFDNGEISPSYKTTSFNTTYEVSYKLKEDTKKSRKTKLHVFLDINGVLNNRSSVLEGVFFLREKIQLLNILLFEYNPVLVISSDWKHSYPIEYIIFVLDMLGLTQGIDVTHTCNMLTKSKGEEIDDYLREYDIKNNHFVIFDDVPFKDKRLSNHTIEVNPETGLIYDDISQARAMFDFQPN